MRRLLALALALLAPATAPAADPPIVFQTQPVGRVLDDARTVLGLAAGEKVVKEFNDELKKSFGEKGLDGLDLSRGVVGYAVIAAKLEQSATVVALPITNEADFLALIERANKQKPKALAGGLYELPKSEFADKAMMRVVGDYAYLCTANDPTPHLDPKAIVPANTLYDVNELALACGKVYPDRLPKEVKAAAEAALADGKKFLANPPNIGAQEAAIMPFAKAFLALGEQAVAAMGQVQDVALRLNLDVPAADMVAELRVTPKAGSLLGTLVAARGPSANRFAGFFTPDTVGGFKLSLPLFTEDIRTAVAGGLDEIKKMAGQNAPPNAKPAADEFFNGLARVAKAGDWDLAAAVRGPDKNGQYSVVAAMSFEDGAAFEKAFRKFVDADAPPTEKENFKWDVAKANGVNIHEYAVAKDASATWLKLFGGNKSSVAFAAGPKGIYITSGADAVGTMKEVLAAKPGPSPAFDVSLNPARLVKLIGVAGDPQAAAQAEQVLGKDDKLVSALSLTVTGGKDLRVTKKLNAKILPGFVYSLGAKAEATFEPVQPPIKKE